MLGFRRALVPLGLLGTIAAGACLVFDGLEADTGEGDARMDVARGDEPSGDSSREGSDGSAASDADHDDGVMNVEAAPPNDAAKPPPKDATSANGVICNVGAGKTTYCQGGSGTRCCAKGAGTGKEALPPPWAYANPPCDLICSSAPPLRGYYDYECDDDDSCNPGDVCCALDERADARPPPYTTSKCMTKASCTGPYKKELCQPGHACSDGLECIDASLADLPPGYRYCK